MIHPLNLTASVIGLAGTMAVTQGDRHVVLDKSLPPWLVSPNADVLWADVLVPWEWGWGGTGGGQSTH